jgi:hypothetical protein
MPEGGDKRSEMGYYFALAQAGVEMVVPIFLGAYLDSWLGWTPWLTAAGVVLGLGGSLLHIVLLLKQHDDPPESRQDKL